MILIDRYIKIPDDAELIVDLLNRFGALKEEQIVIYALQIDKCFNRNRVEKIIKTLLKKKIVERNGEVLSINDSDWDENFIDAFWVALQRINVNTHFAKAEYPSEIVLKNGNTIEEIIVMDDDSQAKISFLSKRKKGKIKEKYFLLFPSGTIDNYDDELIKNYSVTLVTMNSNGSDMPKISYHEVKNNE